MVRRFDSFDEYKGEIPQRTNGVAIAQEEGVCTPYALFNIGERVQMFVEPGTHVYEGMIVGMNSRSDDMVVNPCKAKRVSNMRAAGSDDAIKLSPPRTFTLEEALEFITRRRAGRDNSGRHKTSQETAPRTGKTPQRKSL